MGLRGIYTATFDELFAEMTKFFILVISFFLIYSQLAAATVGTAQLKAQPPQDHPLGFRV